MPLQVIDQNSKPLDAHYDIDGTSIAYHSRGGTKNSSNSRNLQYGDGLRIILSRLKDAGIGIKQAFVDSSVVQEIPINQRRILESKPIIDDVYAVFTELAKRMADVKRDDSGTKKGGNPTKKIRIETTAKDAESLRVAMKGIPIAKGPRSQERLPAKLLNKVGEQHIYNAVQLLLSGNAKHPFSDSEKFDVLLEDGTRLPPKAVFGIAAKEALGIDIAPRNIRGEVGSVTFRIIEACGYTIVPKSGSEPATKTPKPAASAPAIISDEDREFAEGKVTRIEHLKRERHQGASKAKKAAFRGKHGILFCERCKMKPIEVYGSEVGEACIEVHHTKPIADMKEGDKTKLDDLQCLCASCHRVVHRELRFADV
jgi:5-methylcytosine-specific restriction protein A